MKTIKSCGTPNTENIFFDWPLTNWCNYKCSYCPVIDVITNDFTKDDHTHLYKLTLAKLRQVETSFNVCLTGGEPSLHPHIIEILEELVKLPKSQNISMFTNLSRPLKFYERINQIGSNKIVVFASYHPEFSTEKFTTRCLEVGKIDTLLFSVHVTLSDKQEHWAKTQELMDTLRANNIAYKPCLLAPTPYYTPKYTDEFRSAFDSYLEDTGKNTSGNEFFKEVAIVYTDGTSELVKDYDIELKQLNRFKGYKCTPMSYQIRIDGTIENTCTRRVAPLMLNNKNLIVDEICPQDICPSRRLLNFYKEQV